MSIPKFYHQNFIRTETLNSITSGAANLPRLFDRDTELLWQSVGSNDATTEILEAHFQVGGIPIIRIVDTVAIFNHNVKTIILESWDGAAWIAVPSGTIVTPGGIPVSTFFELPGGSISTERFRFKFVDTIIPNVEKFVGEVFILGRLLTFSDGLRNLSVRRIPTVQTVPGIDGGFSINQLRFAGNRVDRYNASMTFTFMSQTRLDQVLGLMRRGVFEVYPEPDVRVNEIFRVTATSAIPSDYTVDAFKTPGLTVTMEVNEV